MLSTGSFSRFVSLLSCVALLLTRGISKGQSDDIRRSVQSLAGGAKTARSIAVKPAPIGPHSLYAPMASLDDPARAQMLLNNTPPTIMDAQYTIYSRNGEILATDTLTLSPNETRFVTIADLLKKTGTERREDIGAIKIDYQGPPMGLLAQLTFLGDKERNSIDGLFDMVLPSTSQDAVWPMPRNARAMLALGNAGPSPISAELTFDSAKPEKITIPSHATRILEFKTDRNGELGHHVHVSYEGAKGTLIEQGFVMGEHGYAAPIRFYDRSAAQQTDLFATDLPLKRAIPAMGLLNTSDSVVVAHPQLFPIGGTDSRPIDLDEITLAPGQAVSVNFGRALEVIGSRGSESASVHVGSTGLPGDLIGSLVSVRGEDERDVVAEVPLRNPGMPGNSTGSYPLRFDGDYSNVVTITNTAAVEKKFLAYIKSSFGKYIFAPQSLKPGETARFDLNEIKAKQQKDAFGQVLPANLKTAKFVWTMSGPYGPSRMIGRNYLTSAQNRVSASFSCGVCCPSNIQGPFVFPEPGGVMLIGGFQSGSVTLQENDCSGNFTSFPWTLGASFSTPNVCSESESTGSYQVNAIAPGSTSLDYDQQLLFISTDGDATCTEQMVDNPVSDPIEVPPQVHFSSLNGIPQGGTATVQVSFSDASGNSVSSSAVPITLSLSTDNSTTGGVTFADGTTSKQITTPVTVTLKGTTTSSTANNIKLDAQLSDGTSVANPPLKTTVVSVTLLVRAATGSTVTSGDTAVNAYATATGQSASNAKIGAFIVSSGANAGCAIGTELVGSVQPTNYTGSVFLLRWIMHERAYSMTSSGTKVVSSIDAASLTDPNTFDTSAVALLDTNPQGTNVGQVYALDAPIDGPATGETLRLRQTFRVFAVLDSISNRVPVSPALEWFARQSCSVNSSGIFSRVTDVVNDNQGGQGCTPVSADLSGSCPADPSQ